MPGAYGLADPLLLLLAALVAEAYLGGFGWLDRLLRAPKRWLAAGAALLESRLDRPGRAPAMLRLRGAATLLLLVGTALGGAWLLALFTRFYPFAWAIELLLLAAMLQQRRIHRDAARLLAAAAAGDGEASREAFRRLGEGRRTAGEIAGLAPSRLLAEAPEELARRAVGTLAAPLFWFLLLGLPGIVGQQAARLLAFTLGARATAPFAGPARALERALEWLPDRLMALMLAGLGGQLAALRPIFRAEEPSVAALTLALPQGVGPQDRLRAALRRFRDLCFLEGGLLALALLLRVALRAFPA